MRRIYSGYAADMQRIRGVNDASVYKRASMRYL